MTTLLSPTGGLNTEVSLYNLDILRNRLNLTQVIYSEHFLL